MFKKFLIFVSSVIVLVGLLTIGASAQTGDTDNCVHEWQAADCLNPETCKFCGLTQGEALGHNFSSPESIRVPATPDADGYFAEKCAVCSAEGEKIRIIHRPIVTISETSYVYDGKVKRPAITITDAVGSEFYEGMEYNLMYDPGRKNVGTYNVSVNFINEYSGSVKFSFKITPRSLSKATFKLANSKYYYSKSGTKVKANVKVDGLTVPQSELTYTYKNNKKVGTATVKITANKNFKGSKQLSFKIYPKVSATSLTLYEDASQKFTASSSHKITYTVGNKKVIQLSGGKIKALKPGSTTIKVKSNGYTVSVKVTIKKVKLNITKLSTYSGYVRKLKVEGATGKYTWSSSNKSVVKVSSTGKITPLKRGTCYIYAKNSKRTLKCKITVSKYYEGTKIPDFGAYVGKLPDEIINETQYYVEGYTKISKSQIDGYKKELKAAGFKYWQQTKSNGVTVYMYIKNYRVVGIGRESSGNAAVMVI